MFANIVGRGATRAARLFILLLTLAPGAAFAQGGATVTGSVRASNGEGMAGAAVRLADHAIGTLTDAAGNFRIANVPFGRQTIIVEQMGFRTVRREVDVRAALSLEFTLSESAMRVAAVVVTATGVAQRQMESPVSTGVVSGPEMRETRPSHPAEVAGRVAGAWVSVAGSGEGHMTSIRQPLSTNPVYLYLEDGIPTRSTGFFNHNALYEINVPQAGRMEILKGPGTALYGSDAIGGVINVETRAPSAHTTAELYAEGGGYGWNRGLFSLSGTRGSNGIRADLNVTKWDGWRDASGYDRQSATVRWDHHFASDLRLKTVAAWSRIDQIDPSALPRPTFESTAELNYFPIATREIEAFRVSSALELQRNGFGVTVTPFARWNEMSLVPFWMLTFDPVTYTSGHKSAGILARAYYELAALRTRVTGGVDVDYSPGRRLERIITPARDGSLFTSFTNGDVIYDYDVAFRGASPYLQLEVVPVRGLHLSGGLRYDHIGYEYDNKLDVVTTGRHRRPADTTVEYDHVSPKLGMAWEIAPQLGLFGSYRHSFRAPSEGQLFRQGSAISTVDLKPIRADALEAGLRGALSVFDYEITAYDMRVQDDVLTFIREDNQRETQNAGETRHRGIEVGAGADVTEWLRLDAAYSHAKHTYESWNPRATLSYSGKEIERAPRDLFNTRVRIDPAFLRGGQASLEWVRVGSYWEDPENANRYEGHNLLNVRASVGLPYGTQLVARIVNLTDERYAENATFTAAEHEQLNPGAPRMIYLGVQANLPRK
jgi:iron complex outermembrane recepter protein